jgi:putative ABC transport system permease protein
MGRHVRLRFVAAMIRRELIASGRRFGLYGTCMAIGIAVVVGLHSLREAVDEAVDLQSRELLGADLRLESRNAFGPAMQGALEELEQSALVPGTEATRLGSMALAERSGRSRLIDLLAIEGDYPLYGSVWTEPAHRWSEFADAEGRVFVDATLLIQLDVEIGDRLRIGGQSFEIAAAVKKAPGSSGLQAEVAPRVFMKRVDLDRTDLVQLGSLTESLRFFKLPDGVAESWRAEHEELLAEERVRVQTVAGYQEDLSEAFDTLTRYLGLVGLAALVLGSIGVAAGVRVFVREKLDTVALLRSIGVSPREVVAVYGGLAACLGLIAGLMGILLCLPFVAVLPSLIGDLLPVEVGISIGPAALATGLGLSIWATLLCAIGPVLDLARVAPLRALRRDFGEDDDRGGSGRRGAIALVAASLVGASIWQADDLKVGLGFAVGLIATVGVLALAAVGLILFLRRHPPRRAAYWIRQGVANLFRPRNHTLPTTIAIGFALFIVATVHGVQRNVLDQLAVDTRPDRPNFVLFDVQRDQGEAVEVVLAAHGAKLVDQAPLVSARLSGVGGRTRSNWLTDENLSKSMRWALQREYRLTYADALRDTEELIAGTWWSPGDRFEPDRFPVSLERDLAISLGVELGDPLTWQIQGVEIESYVASLRQVDWGRMATNFFVVFPVAALENAPQSSVLLAHLASDDARAELQRDLVGEFPNVSALDATVILRSLDAMMNQISTAIRLLSIFTLGTGIAILVAASMAARSERVREFALLRVLGASRSIMRRIAATEAIALALLSAVVGGGLAVVACWVVVVFVFELPFDLPWRDLIGLSTATFVLTALAGGVSGFGGRMQSAQEGLRRDSV